LGVEPGILRWRISDLIHADLIHATVAEWLRANRLFAKSRARLPRLKSPDFIRVSLQLACSTVINEISKQLARVTKYAWGNAAHIET